MSAGTALQAALVPGLAGIAGIAGVFDGPPPGAPFPYVVIDAGNENDWGHKSGAGREVALSLTLWDAQAERLDALADAIERQLEAIGAVAGWQPVGAQLMRRRVVRDVAGPWAVALDYRVRLLAETNE